MDETGREGEGKERGKGKGEGNNTGQSKGEGKGKTKGKTKGTCSYSRKCWHKASTTKNTTSPNSQCTAKRLRRA
jgi:hypothetical protein